MEGIARICITVATGLTNYYGGEIRFNVQCIRKISSDLCHCVSVNTRDGSVAN